MKKFLFILFGAPGSGKGYLGECLRQEMLKQKLVTENDISYISTGDLLRAEMAAQTPLGVKITETMNAGRYVSDDIVDALVEKSLREPQAVKFLDGYPRTKEQLKKLREILEKLDMSIISIYRDTPVYVIQERVSRRRVCQKCRMTHSVDDGKCPKCGGRSIIRKDDALIKRRLSQYKKSTVNLWPELKEMAFDWWWVDGTCDATGMARRILCSFL